MRTHRKMWERETCDSWVLSSFLLMIGETSDLRLEKGKIRDIERWTYQCFFHKRDRADRTLYKAENIRKLPDFYGDCRRGRDRH